MPTFVVRGKQVQYRKATNGQLQFRTSASVPWQTLTTKPSRNDFDLTEDYKAFHSFVSDEKPKEHEKKHEKRDKDKNVRVVEEEKKEEQPAEPPSPPVIIRIGAKTLCGNFHVKDVKASVLAAQESSGTVLMTGFWKPDVGDIRQAIMKVGAPDDPSWQAERFYNQNVVPKLRLRTPHVVTAFVTDCEVSSSDFSAKAILDAWKKVSLPMNAPAMIMRRAPGKTLLKILEKDRPKWSRAEQQAFDLSTALQIAQALSVFETMSVRHNDLHMENIICQPLKEPFVLPYCPVAFFVRIIDFGFASLDPKAGWPNPAVAPRTDRCQEYGECQRFVKNFDWQRVVASFAWELKGKTELLKLVKLTLPKTKNYWHSVLGCKLRELEINDKNCVLDKARLDAMVSPSAFLAAGHKCDLQAIRKLCARNK